MMEFLLNENRYRTLKRQLPELADNLFNKAIKNKQKKHEYYKKLAEL